METALKIAIINIGTIVSGDWRAPLIDCDSILIADGKFKAVGKITAEDIENSDLLIDANGTTACPGLIDSHVHNSFGDYTPKQQAVGFLQSYLHGGTTTCISASEIHVA